VNFVLDIETIPRDLRAEPRKIQEYVWERVTRRGDPEDGAPALDQFLAGMDDEAFAGLRRDVERGRFVLRPLRAWVFEHVEVDPRLLKVRSHVNHHDLLSHRSPLPACGSSATSPSGERLTRPTRNYRRLAWSRLRLAALLPGQAFGPRTASTTSFDGRRAHLLARFTIFEHDLRVIFAPSSETQREAGPTRFPCGRDTGRHRPREGGDWTTSKRRLLPSPRGSPPGDEGARVGG